MLLLLLGILAGVFWVTWLVMDAVAWAVLLAGLVLLGGVAIGSSTDID